MARRLAIIGGGPIGIEAAVYAEDHGWEPRVYERDVVGANVRRWGHVRFFSPWSLNRSAWGEARVDSTEPIELNGFPTGEEYVENYLSKLAQTLEEPPREGVWVEAIGRRDALKGDFIGSKSRKAGPFLLRVVSEGAASFEEADVVVDATGVYGQPSNLGPGGLPAIGEVNGERFIEHHIPDLAGEDGSLYANSRVLVIGAGHSAVTSLRGLHDLRADYPETEIVWLRRSADAPYERFENDPLPERDRLGAFGNQAARGLIDGIAPRVGMHVWRIEARDDGLQVTLRDGEREEILEVDRIVANVGYRPNLSLNRELQVHQCYASEGPMKLAATLLGQSGGDCLEATSSGVETLMNPEPDYFVLGHKSYGRNSAFLLKVGFTQIEELFSHLKAGEIDAA